MTPATDVRQFYEIADRVERLPGVRAAGFTQLLPLQNWGWTSNSIDFQERGRPPERRVFPIELRFVTPGYFRALGIPVRGRAFTDRDDQHAPFVILINEALARKSFPGEDPIGKKTTRGTIVGVVGDVRQANLDRPSVPELYTAIAQNWSQVSELGLTLVVNAADRPERLIDSVRGIVRDVNPNLAVFRIKTMDAVVADSLADFTIYLTLIAAAAGLALVMAIDRHLRRHLQHRRRAEAGVRDSRRARRRSRARHRAGALAGRQARDHRPGSRSVRRAHGRPGVAGPAGQRAASRSSRPSVQSPCSSPPSRSSRASSRLGAQPAPTRSRPSGASSAGPRQAEKAAARSRPAGLRCEDVCHAARRWDEHRDGLCV